ncbi:YjcZ family sporulation protein [Paenibacillus sp. D2_2]|nr:YjcZ family sporulation protein [Paenibacillus sp. D2_2]WMT43195.1 YjcZ family sporulation protein [Paenibacillus sp. D2_2]
MGGVVGGVGEGCYGPGVGGLWTSTGAILVLFILLVIITRSFCFN